MTDSTTNQNKNLTEEEKDSESRLRTYTGPMSIVVTVLSS